MVALAAQQHAVLTLTLTLTLTLNPNPSPNPNPNPNHYPNPNPNPNPNPDPNQVPLVVCAGLYKLTPTFPSGAEQFNVLRSP